jgi:hypothetical protein
VPGTGHRPEWIRYTLPRHKRGAWVGPGRTRKSTQPGASSVIELTPFEFLDRLAALIPPPRRHRHRYHGVFAPNHPLRPAVTALAIGNIGKKRDAMESRASMTRRGLPGRSYWHGWIIAWLDARPDVECHKTGDEFDIWHGNYDDIEDGGEQDECTVFVASKLRP